MAVIDFLDHGERLARAVLERPLEWIRSCRDPVLGTYDNLRVVRFPLGAPVDPGLGVTRVAEVRFRPGFHIGDPGRPPTRFALVVRGRGWLVTDRQRTPLHAGCFFTRIGDEPHDLIAALGGPLQLLVVECSGGYVRRLHHQLFGAASVVARPAETDRVRAALDRIIDQAVAGGEHAQAIAGCETELLLRRMRFEDAATAPGRGRAYERYLRCRQQIEAESRKLLGVGPVARRARIDPSYLGRLFRRFEACSPTEFLMRCKMAHACDELLVTDRSIQAIGEGLGFDDPFAFSRAFKRVLGVAPRHYRQGVGH